MFIGCYMFGFTRVMFNNWLVYYFLVYLLLFLLEFSSKLVPSFKLICLVRYREMLTQQIF
ncbi:hypothetical protein [Pseudomonas aeruginosa]|uniref:hypothetical protein n=1 Tax=Pseudomonas aeruginosa TaxID=287 RepID=UPI003D18B8F8